MRSARPWVLIGLTSLIVLSSGAALAAARPAAKPGDPVAGRKIFKDFCAPCHNFKATNSVATLARKEGVAGSDLDVLKPRYSRVVAAVVQGEGGLAAEYFLRRLTFKQIYDVAAFVSKYAGKTPAPTSRAHTPKPPPNAFTTPPSIPSSGAP
jgi:mono/diheme cytochrome c family protein